MKRSLLVALLCLWSASAKADADRVLVLLASSEIALGHRVTAELLSLDLVPLGWWVEQPPSAEEMLSLCRDQDAGLALSIVRHAAAATLVIADRTTGKSLRRDVMLETLGDDLDALLALSAVELLHASLLELKADHPARGDLQATPKLVALASSGLAVEAREPQLDVREHARSPFALLVGLAVAGSPRSTAPLGQLRLGLELTLGPRVRLGLDAYLAAYAQTIERGVGTADLWSSTLWLCTRVSLLQPGRVHPLTPYLAPGFFGALVTARGRRRQAGYDTRESRGVSGGPGLALSLDGRVSERVGVRVDLLAAYALSRFEIYLGEHQVARLGQPLLLGALSLRVEL